MITQSFFIHRIKLVTSRHFIPALMALLTFVQFGFAVTLTVKINNVNREFTRFAEFT